MLADAEAVGILDQIDPKYQSETAIAEAEVALMLAQPAYFGLPPSQIEHWDSRTQHWPGYDQPVRCHLVRYRYGDSYENVAITGPLTHTLRADLNDLAPGEIYAIYAGWVAEHESMQELEPSQWTDQHQAIAQQLMAQLRGHHFDALQGALLGLLDGTWILVARATRDGLSGLVVYDGNRPRWYADRQQRFPLGPHEVYWIYKGQYLLQLFNS